MEQKKNDQLVDEEAMETASVVPPKPGEEAGEDGAPDGPETKPASTVGD